MANFLYLPGWTVNAVHPGTDLFTAEASYDPEPDTCAKCGVVGQLYRHGSKVVDYRDAPIRGRQVVIRVERRRYRCRACASTFLQPLPDMEEGRRMTVRCREYIEEQGLKRPFTQVADDIGIDEKTVRLICADRIAALDAAHRPSAPRVLGIDEVHIMKRARAVLTDAEQGLLIDMLAERDKATVARWVSRLPGKDRVKVVTIDMHRPYFDVVAMLLPQAAVVVDKWHVQRMASDALEGVRKAIQRDLSPNARRLSKRGRYLLLARRASLKARGELALSGWLANAPPALKAAYDAKEAFYDLWSITTREEAEAAYDAWAAALPPDTAKAFKPLLTAVKNWRGAVFAYWDHRITNARTETLNGLVKQVNRAGRGYSFEVLRARMLAQKGQPRPTESMLRCDICLGTFEREVLQTMHLKPLRAGGKAEPGNRVQVCATCHRFHTTEWFRRDAHSTRQSE